MMLLSAEHTNQNLATGGPAAQSMTQTTLIRLFIPQLSSHSHRNQADHCLLPSPYEKKNKKQKSIPPLNTPTRSMNTCRSKSRLALSKCFFK